MRVQRKDILSEETSSELVLFVNKTRPCRDIRNPSWRKEREEGKTNSHGNKWVRKEVDPAPGIRMIELSSLPWQLRTTSCQMMGRVLINNTGSDWLPAGGSRVRYTESYEQWFWFPNNNTWLPGCSKDRGWRRD